MRKILSFFVAALMSAGMFGQSYTAAGSSTVLFGTAWDPANTANDLSLVSGTSYQLVKEGVVLPAGEIAFKVCENHAWTTAYPSQDYKFTIATSGKYDVTITFDSSSKQVGASATKVGDAVALPSIMMHGNFTGAWADTQEFTVADDNSSASLKINVAVGNYEFGMKIGGTWSANGVVFTKDNTSAVITSGSGNLKLAATIAGEYTFTWTYETNTLSITFPEGEEEEIIPTVAIAGEMNSWSVTANLLTISEDKLTATGKISLAAQGYEFKVVVGGTWLTTEGASISRDANSLADVKTEGGEGNNLYLDADVAGDYEFTWTFAENKLEVTFPAKANPDIADGVANTAADVMAVKFIENGQLYIHANGNIYTVMGQMVR